MMMISGITALQATRYLQQHPSHLFSIPYYFLRGYYSFEMQNENYKCNPMMINFWNMFAEGRWEKDLIEYLHNYLNSDSVFLDVGAWIGPTVLYAAKRCKTVYCFEPNKRTFKTLENNIKLNGLRNVVPINAALSDKSGQMIFSRFGDDSTFSALNPSNEGEIVDVIGWSDWINAQEIDFIKTDIEGGEFSLIPSMKTYLMDHKPIVHLSTHCQYLDTKKRASEMQKIVDTLKIYDNCFNKHGKPIHINSLLDDSVLNAPRAFLFR